MDPEDPPSKRAKTDAPAPVPQEQATAVLPATLEPSTAPLENGNAAAQPAAASVQKAAQPEAPAAAAAAQQEQQQQQPLPHENAATAPPLAAAAAPPPAPAAPPAPVAAPILPLDTYCTRELRHIDRETAGELSALYVRNDGQPDSGRLLIGLKNVFSKCLPNMPKTYITRLLFDRRHRSVVIVRNGSKVIGGITYRPFHERRFAEIAFCAVAQTLQVSGFGTRLMNWTKHYARQHDACEYFLTYADNNAVGYFSKQGFTKTLTMPRDRWHGYIKDYDGGTLMEGYIHPTLPYTQLPRMIAEQRAALDKAVRQYTTAHVVHPGLERWKEGAGGTVPVGDVPGVVEAGWTPAAAAAAEPRCQLQLGGRLVPATQANLMELQRRLLAQLEAEGELIWPFLEPVDATIVPDYYDLVKNPIDLSTIRQRVESGQFYLTLDIFEADVQRMFANAKFYNSPDTPYYKAAHKLAGMFQGWVNAAVHYDLPTAAAPSSQAGGVGVLPGMPTL